MSRIFESTRVDASMQPYLNRFKQLYVRDNDNVRSNDVLECVYDTQDKIRDKFVIHDDHTRTYLVFPSHEAALKYIDSLPLTKRNYHEVIFGWRPQKLKFDLDIKEDDLKHLNVTIKQTIVAPEMTHAEIPQDFMDSLFSGADSLLAANTAATISNVAAAIAIAATTSNVAAADAAAANAAAANAATVNAATVNAATVNAATVNATTVNAAAVVGAGPAVDTPPTQQIKVEENYLEADNIIAPPVYDVNANANANATTLNTADIDLSQFGISAADLSQITSTALDALLSPKESDYTLKTSAEKVEWLLKCFDDALIATFYLLYFRTLDPRQIITCTSSGRDTPSSPYKHSYHKIVYGYMVENNVECKTFTNILLDTLDQRIRPFVDSVNKQTQNFRMIGCVKHGSVREKRIADHCRPPSNYIPPLNTTLESAQRYAPVDTIVTNVVNCIRLPTTEDYLDKGEAGAGNGADFQSVITDADAKRVLELASGHTTGQRFRGRKGNLFSFDRDRPTHCQLCEEVHHCDNTVYLTCKEDGGFIHVFLNCRHNRKAPARGLGYVVMDAIAGDVNIDPKDYGTEKAKVKTGEASIRRAVKAVAGKEVHITSLFDTLPAAQRNVYTQDTLLDFELRSTLCVKAKMKMGKTKKLREFIDRNFAAGGIREPIIRILSFRQTFSGNIKEKFKDFTLYSDVKGPLTQERLIIQVESLHRIEINVDIDVPDLIVMDECESIFEQFESGLLKNFGLAWGVFQWLLRTSRNLIAMDANLSDRTFRVLNSMRIDYFNTKYPEKPPRLLYYHCNEFKNQVGDTYRFTNDKSAWYIAADKELAKNHKIVVPMSSLREAEVFRKDLEQRYPDRHIGFYSSKTSSSQKKDHFANVGEFWSQYDVLIYTPTVSAGVSYEEKHYDVVFGYFTDKSCNVETCLQMLGRIRNVSQRQYTICLSSTRNNLPTDIVDIESTINSRRMNLFRQFDSSLLQIEFTDAGEIKCHRSDYFYLWLENMRIRNLSLNDFATRFIRYIAEGGAQVIMLEVDATPQELEDVTKRRKVDQKRTVGRRHRDGSEGAGPDSGRSATDRGEVRYASRVVTAGAVLLRKVQAAATLSI